MSRQIDRLPMTFCLAVLLFTPLLSAQEDSSYQVPRTYLGQPDFEGTWHTEFVTLLERLDGVEELVVSEQEAAEIAARVLAFIPHNEDPDFEWQGVNQLARVRGELRSSLIVDPEDGRLPYLDSALPEVDYYANRYLTEFDHPEQRNLGERCLYTAGGPPINAIPLMFPYQVVQTGDHFMLYAEGPVGTRVVHLDSGRRAGLQLSHQGYSTGRWEGDTLVVTTTHFRPDHAQRSGFGRPMLISPDSVIEERFTRVSDTELNYYFTVTDATLYSQPWSAEFSLFRHEGPLYEYACHEGNYSLRGILVGGQMEMEAAAQ